MVLMAVTVMLIEDSIEIQYIEHAIQSPHWMLPSLNWRQDDLIFVEVDLHHPPLTLVTLARYTRDPIPTPIPTNTIFSADEHRGYVILLDFVP
jgi:hypothetical protein